MPQRQAHRGKHPEDGRLFSADRIPDLRRATADLSILLDRGYSETASLKLVGDRYQLDARQRRAVVRAACPDQTIRERQARNVSFSDLQNNVVDIDGYNLLLAAERILSGGVGLRCRARGPARPRPVAFRCARVQQRATETTRRTDLKRSRLALGSSCGSKPGCPAGPLSGNRRHLRQVDSGPRRTLDKSCAGTADALSGSVLHPHRSVLRLLELDISDNRMPRAKDLPHMRGPGRRVIKCGQAARWRRT